MLAFDPALYDPPDPASIPPRGWLYGGHYLRGSVSASIGLPGRLKSTVALIDCIGMPCGRNLFTGQLLDCGPLRVAYLNGEENQDELDRRAAAVFQHFGVSKADFGDRLYMLSTRDKPVRVAIPGPRGGAVVNTPVMRALRDWCDRKKLDVLVIDPLISFHAVRENDNGDMDVVIKECFGSIAGTVRSVEAVVHPRKPAPGEINTTVEDARGASSQIGAFRLARTFNFMTSKEAEQLGVEEGERRKHVRVDNGKSNPGLLGKADWVRIEVENLPNGDEVACAGAWKPASPFADVQTSDLRLVQEVARAGTFRADSRSPNWLGWWMAENLPHLGVKSRHDFILKDKAEVAKLNNILSIWQKNNALRIEPREDEHRKKRRYFVVGESCQEENPAPDESDNDD